MDTRRRRGLRGRLYGYANATYLQRRLGELGIRYQHEIALAPTVETRQLQNAADRSAGVARRARIRLSEEFIDRYRAICLAPFDLSGFLAQFTGDRRVVIFCVEHDPRACHRSLIASEIQRLLGAGVPDITP